MSIQLTVITATGIAIIVLAAVFIGYAALYYRRGPYLLTAREPERILEEVRHG